MLNWLYFLNITECSMRHQCHELIQYNAIYVVIQIFHNLSVSQLQKLENDCYVEYFHLPFLLQ